MFFFPEIALEEYLAPDCSVMQLFSDAGICETSFGSGNIEPGRGEDWGVF